MKKQEAIEKLKCWISEYKEALSDEEMKCSDDLTKQITEELEMAQTALNTLQNQTWIPCAERMPEFEKQVLICASGKVYTATRFKYMTTEWWAVNNTGNASYMKPTEMTVVRAKAIKYWMPVPEVPEVPEGEEK